MNLAALLKELEVEESHCCTAYALYNLLRSYPLTLFERDAPGHEEFAAGLARMTGVGPLPENRGMSDRALDAVAKGLGLKGQAVALPGSEAELRKLLAAPGAGCLGRVQLREGNDSVAGVRHSLILLPVEPDRKPPHYEALDSNAGMGERAHVSWKDLSRMLCGLYVIEVHGPRRELGNTLPGFGAKKDLERRPRRPDITALRKALAEFAMNEIMGMEALQAAMRAHPKSGILLAFRAAVQFALAAKPAQNSKLGAKIVAEIQQGIAGEARDYMAEALRLEPGLRERLPGSLTCARWKDPVEAFSALGVLAVSPKADDPCLSAEVQKRLRPLWS